MIPRISLAALMMLALTVPMAFTQQAGLQKVKINYPARSGGSWPLFIAKEGGYYQKYGLDVELVFGAGNILWLSDPVLAVWLETGQPTSVEDHLGDCDECASRLEELTDEARLPSGDELSGEIERFLRGRDPNGGDPPR